MKNPRENDKQLKQMEGELKELRTDVKKAKKARDAAESTYAAHTFSEEDLTLTLTLTLASGAAR